MGCFSGSNFQYWLFLKKYIFPFPLQTNAVSTLLGIPGKPSLIFFGYPSATLSRVSLVAVTFKHVGAPVCCEEDRINGGVGADVVIVEGWFESWNNWRRDAGGWRSRSFESVQRLN